MNFNYSFVCVLLFERVLINLSLRIFDILLKIYNIMHKPMNREVSKISFQTLRAQGTCCQRQVAEINNIDALRVM